MIWINQPALDLEALLVAPARHAEQGESSARTQTLVEWNSSPCCLLECLVFFF